MKYKVCVPPTPDQGSYRLTVTGSAQQTYRAEALQDYNSARAHDGQPPLSRMPRGTSYAPIMEYAIQMHTSEGWEDVCTESTRKEAVEQIACYRENQPGAYRIKRRASED